MSTPSLRLDTCAACGGLRPATRACPHCDAPAPRTRWPGWARTLARATAGGAALVTLMACYGMAPGYRPAPNDPRACPGGDADHDGVCAPMDCNDHDPNVYPGAADPDGDGIDQSCDGVDGWRDPATVATTTPAATTAPAAATSAAPAPTPADAGTAPAPTPIATPPPSP